MTGISKQILLHIISSIHHLLHPSHMLTFSFILGFQKPLVMCTYSSKSLTMLHNHMEKPIHSMFYIVQSLAVWKTRSVPVFKLNNVFPARHPYVYTKIICNKKKTLTFCEVCHLVSLQQMPSVHSRHRKVYQCLPVQAEV